MTSTEIEISAELEELKKYLEWTPSYLEASGYYAAYKARIVELTLELTTVHKKGSK